MVVLVSLSQFIHAGESGKSELELGALLGGQFAAEYRGSEYYSTSFLPLPYIYYQSRIFKVDRNGVRGEFWKADRWQLNVSLDGSIGGSGEGSPYRRGMKELETAVEFGPSIDILLAGKGFEDGWVMRIPVRGVVALGSSGIDPVGFVFNPRLSWRKPSLGNDWRVSVHLGALFADRDYHDYFYSVDEDDALPWRPLYRAQSGYSGSFIRVNYYRQWQAWRWGVSLRYDNLSGAKFMDSPLIETDHYGSIAFVVMRKFWSKILD